MDVEVGQLWRRKKDDVLVLIKRTPASGSAYSFSYAQNLRSGRHFEVTAAQIEKRYEFVGYDASDKN